MHKFAVYFYLVAVAWSLWTITAWGLPQAAKLNGYNVDPNRTSVSGLSSGGFMAVQMHVAYSSNMIGAGIFAGGPYNCAQGQIATATSTCMSGYTPPSVSAAISTTDQRAKQGLVDPTSYLADQRVYLFSGTQDSTVRPPVMDALNDYYRHYVVNGTVEYVNTLNAAHTQPTDDPINKNACTTSASPYISYCAYDGSGQALELIMGPLNPRNDGTLTGVLSEFDQTEFIGADKGMASAGWVYVPKSCAEGASCVSHIAFHGCLQDYSKIGSAWVKNTGYNKWADTNDIIVLYPQATASYITPSNPNGCWDWWGYNSNPQTYDTKQGVQMQAIYAMIQRIASGFVQMQPPTGLHVANATNNSVTVAWDTASQASSYNVYRSHAKVNSRPITTNSYRDTGLTSGSTFTYSVSAVTANGGESEKSEPITAKTTGVPPPLAAPTDLRAVSVDSTSITLQWSPVEGATDYNVYRDGALISPAPDLDTQYTDEGLQAETTYSYWVSSLNEIGYESAPSAKLQVKTSSGWQCQQWTADNYAQVVAGRAYQQGGYCYAVGSDDYMGLYNTFQKSTLAETKENYYVVGDCS